MKTNTSIVSKDITVWSGVILIILSLLIFLIPNMFSTTSEDSAFGIFIINYMLTIAFLITLVVNKLPLRANKKKSEKRGFYLLFAVLALISSFSLNRAIPIFEESTNWLSAFIIIECLTMISFVIFYKLPWWVENILIILLGSGLVLFIYYAIYLSPFYLIGLFGSLAFGIGFHVFTPLILAILSLSFFISTYKRRKKALIPYLFGVLTPLIIVVFFTYQWNQRKMELDYLMNESIISNTNLPKWAKLSQKIDKGLISRKMLKSNLVNTLANQRNRGALSLPNQSFNEVRKHDPLILIADLVVGSPNLTRTERIKILESMYDSRHEALERLWSGNDLETTNLISDIQIFPNYRMAYTEKTLSIKNNLHRNWRAQQEAIYTFYLPEGGIVTSLSLWVEGQERKGILTTKGKAVDVYNTIVGKEARDPSVVHWQEGNTVSVRVFPCTPDENRRFKIGFTAPLKYNNKKLIYENIYFDGPPANKTTETIRMQFESKPSNFNMPFSMKANGDQVYTANKSYDPYWEVEIEAPELSSQGFSFNSFTYGMANYVEKYEHFEAKAYHLDVNSSWSSNEFFELLSILKGKPVVVFTDQIVEVTSDNAKELFRSLNKMNFSIYPFHLIDHPDSAMVISKSALPAPNLADLKGSGIANGIADFFGSNRHINLYDFGEELSPYLKTIKEMRGLNYDNGSIEKFKSLIESKRFISPVENDSTILINNSKLLLTKSIQGKKENGPDHLQRLFAYNHIMQLVGNKYFQSDYVCDETIAEAKEAYVVSPLSSLIVLETKADYERFDINESKNSLKNAAVKSTGSAPEPEEWLLIILALLVLSFYFFKNKMPEAFPGN